MMKGHMSNPWHRLRPFSAAPLVVRRRYLIEAPSPLPATPLVAPRTMLWPLRCCALRVLNRVPRPMPAAPRRYLFVVARRLPATIASGPRGAQAAARKAVPEAPQVLDRDAEAIARGTARCAPARTSLLYPGRYATQSQQEKNTQQMSRQSKYYQLHLHRGKVTHEPESLSDAGPAGTVGRAYVMRIDNRARVTDATATPAVQAHAFTVKSVPLDKSPAHANALRQSLTTRRR
jgi:hypothetical protein